jgi:hypothetical protein
MVCGCRISQKYKYYKSIRVENIRIVTCDCWNKKVRVLLRLADTDAVRVLTVS